MTARLEKYTLLRDSILEPSRQRNKKEQKSNRIPPARNGCLGNASIRLMAPNSHSSTSSDAATTAMSSRSNWLKRCHIRPYTLGYRTGSNVRCFAHAQARGAALAPSSLPKVALPEAFPPGPPEALPYPILRRRSSISPSRAALWWALERRCERGVAAGGGRSRGAGAKVLLNFLSAIIS